MAARSHPRRKSYTLSNVGGTSINWTAGKSAAWVNLGATGGTLAPGANTTVTASINGSTLNVGGYSDTVSFTNTTNGNGDTTRGVALTVNPIPASVSLSNLLQTYDGSPKSASVTTTPSGLAYSVTYGGSPTAPTDAGTYAVVATITEPNHAGSDIEQPDHRKGCADRSRSAHSRRHWTTPLPSPLTATATSGLAVSYSSSNPAVATVSGNTVTIVGLGTTTITASQAGNANYNAAASVPQTLTVGPCQSAGCHDRRPLQGSDRPDRFHSTAALPSPPTAKPSPLMSGI